MRKYTPQKVVLFISIPLAFLIIITSAVGLFSPDFYAAETLGWRVQAAGQDLIDLFLVAPLLPVSALVYARGKQLALGIWGGIILYLIYTFTIYVFAVHFNYLFFLYCVILGISFYAFIFLLFQIYDRNEMETTLSPALKLTANFFIVISLAFYMLWMLQVIPAAFQNKLPDELRSSGLLTNPVHALDLSIYLPGIFITGMLMLHKKPLGFVLAPMVLVFMLLMDITIALLTILMKQKGINNDPTMAFIMFLLGAFALFLLIRIVRIPVVRKHVAF